MTIPLSIGKQETMEMKQVSLQLNPTATGLIVKESKLDPIIAQVMHYVREGWPQRIDSEEIKIFKKMSDSLCVENGCLFLGARIVIPAKLRMGVLDLIHVGHSGMQKMKQLARSVVYWPNINADIENVAKSCISCAEHQNNPSKPANHPWMLPEKPWSRVHVDHAINFMGGNWLVVVDAYSKYPIIHPTTAVSTRATIRLLEEDFAHFGNPHSIVSDNATKFKTEEFQQWCKERGITHLTGAPYHPATNGAAECLVQSFKQSVKTSKRTPKEALQDFLMQYRRTPLGQGLSLLELLNGRQIRTTLDAIVPSPDTTGGKTWTISKTLVGKLNAFEMWTYRKMLRLSYTKHKTNEEALDMLGTAKQLLSNTVKRTWQYFGHLVRQNDIQRQLLEGKTNCKRSRGRPRITWMDKLKKWTGKSYGQLIRRAEDREKFRCMTFNVLKALDTL